MALRTIRQFGDPILNKHAKEVVQLTPNLKDLIDDMFDTMYDAGGVGLAAPQVGILKRIVVIDVSESQDQPIVLVNPTILETSGEQTGMEGCLSLPGKYGEVTRPNYVKVHAFDRNMQEETLEGEGLLARCFVHEIEHLDGHLFTEHVKGDLVEAAPEEGAEEEVTLAVTQPDREKGRGRKIEESAVKTCAEKWNIPVFQPSKIRQPENAERIRAEKPDLIIVAAFGQILSQEILDIPRLGCINVHGSLLPKYRGAAPIQRSILDGEKETGVTIMQMDAGIDTGDMIAQEKVEIAADETSGSLYEKLAEAGGNLLIRTLPSILDGTAVRTPQPEEGASYAKMLDRRMGKIDWTKSAEEIGRLVRGLNPWPSAYTTLGGREFKIWGAAAQDGGSADLECPADADVCAPGTVVCTDKERIYVKTGRGILALTEVQAEGKKRMPASAFMRGFHFEPGKTVLGGEVLK